MLLKFALPLATVSLLAFCRPVQAANPDHVRQLLQTNNCPGCDLSGASLKSLDLSQANLNGANLSRAKLDQTNLSRAQLRQANLQGASIASVNFNGANLAEANFANATNLDLCQLGSFGAGDSFGCLGINLFRTLGNDVCDPDYQLTDLMPFKEFCATAQSSSSGFISLMVSAGSSWFPAFSVRGANLEQTNFEGVNLTGADFRYAALQETNFEGAILRYALFLNTDTSQARNTKFEEAFTSIADIQTVVKAEVEAEDRRRQQRAGYAEMRRHLWAQKSYRSKHDRFAEQLSDLDSAPQKEHFLFTVVPQADGTQHVVIQAKSQHDYLRSLAGLAYRRGETHLQIICETTAPSPVPPTFTTLPSGPVKELACPAGSQKIR